MSEASRIEFWTAVASTGLLMLCGIRIAVQSYEQVRAAAFLSGRGPLRLLWDGPLQIYNGLLLDFLCHGLTRSTGVAKSGFRRKEVCQTVQT